MDKIYFEALKSLEKGHACVLVTILRRKGSVPRDEGAHLLLRHDGSTVGTIGGGGLEAESLKRARELLGSETGYLQSFSLVEGDDPSDMVCGGNVTVLLESLSPTEIPVYQFVSQTVSRHIPCCLVRLFHGSLSDVGELKKGPRGAIHVDGSAVFSTLLDTSLKERLKAWARTYLGEPSRVMHTLGTDELGLSPQDEWTLFVFETLQVFPRLVIFGGGHLSQALCKMAALCLYRVTVADDREEFASPERFPDADRVLCIPNYANLSSLIHLAPHTFAVIATRGHRYDEEVLAQIIRQDLAYIGMVGSRHKNAIVLERLRERGVPPAALERLHAPIGLSIGSETPEEIAVSILGELILTRSRIKSGKGEGK